MQEKERRDSLALTRVLSDHEEALKLESPRGLMVHGEVGTGKSMLIDLFADCLPTRKKRRWHFNTFMLEAFSKLEQLRLARIARSRGSAARDDHSLLWLARDLVEKSPVLFLDEFQLPDRASAKIMTNLMTGFFSLGGVLVATSNRMPDELAKAAGIEFVQPTSRKDTSSWMFGRNRVDACGNKMFGGSAGEFAQFLELLKARCEVWEMEGKSDYRRASEGEKPKDEESISVPSDVPTSTSAPLEIKTPNEEAGLPLKYFVNALPPELETEILASLFPSNTPTTPIPWQPTALKVYGRHLAIPRSHAGATLITFNEICGATLGPADYITLASTFHTFIITEVPVLTSLLKNEARRFITLLDALYEAKCKLFISAAADPDNLFFPELRQAGASESGEDEGGDATYAETFSEMHQDLTAPFRPNVSVYSDSPEPDRTHARLAGMLLAEDALEDDPPNKIKRMMGRTDSDFMSDEHLQVARTPNFAATGIFTGEDEKFAYKRASSRLWEMCGRKWWERSEEGWWRPLPVESRGWEGASAVSGVLATSPAVAAAIAELEAKDAIEGMGSVRDVNETEDEVMFRHGASPYTNWKEPPPKIPWTHAWGMMKWGKKAGAWGQGVEGLKERKKDDER
jgi:predicted ATPase